MVRWMASLFDMGPSASGLIVSGGSMANLTAVVAARTARLGEEFSNGVIYVTRHTHHSVEKAARIAGFRKDQIQAVGIDLDLRMDPEALTAAIVDDRAAGRDPFLKSSAFRPGRPTPAPSTLSNPWPESLPTKGSGSTSTPPMAASSNSAAPRPHRPVRDPASRLDRHRPAQRVVRALWGRRTSSSGMRLTSSTPTKDGAPTSARMTTILGSGISPPSARS